MYRITTSRALNKFKCVRVLKGRDLFSRLGERIPNDRGSIMPRHPSSRQDMADYYIADGFSKIQEQELPSVPPDIPPAVDNESTSE